MKMKGKMCEAETNDNYCSAECAINSGRKKFNRVMFKSSNDNWATPSDVFNSLDSEFHFTYDPCPLNPMYDVDGLSTDWGKRSFVNPPYSNIKEWVKKFEIRFNDRDYQVGDTIEFCLINYETGNIEPTAGVYRIIYVHSGYKLQSDYVILGIEPLCLNL